MPKNTRSLFIAVLLLASITPVISSAANAEDSKSGLTHNANQNKDRNYDSLFSIKHVAPFAFAYTQWGNGADARYDQAHAGNN